MGRVFYGRRTALCAALQGSEHAGRLLHREQFAQDPVNGLPAGCSDDEFPWAREGDPLDTKYPFVTHSELNAILNYRGGSLEGATLYVSLFPCNECAKAIIQSGIRTVVYDSDKYADSDMTIASKRMFDAAGVRYYQYQRTGRRVVVDL